MKEFSLFGFVEHLPKLVAEVALAEHEGLEHAAKIVEREAKESVGHYQPQSGPFVAWAELADSTKDDRERLGFPADEPELRAGALRDSIQHTVETHPLSESVAEIGSDSEVMVFQELGTSNMPPRSILGGAAARKEREVVDVLGDAVVAALIGEEVHLDRLQIL